MGKPKPDSVPNRALYSRISYLHQAASYLATQSALSGDEKAGQDSKVAAGSTISVKDNVARRLVADIREVGHKVLIRQGPGIKRAGCKFCDTVFVEGKTCTTTVENHSKGGKKPWADIMVVRCMVCGQVKRYPVHFVRQKRKPLRSPTPAKEGDDDSTELPGT